MERARIPERDRRSRHCIFRHSRPDDREDTPRGQATDHIQQNSGLHKPVTEPETDDILRADSDEGHTEKPAKEKKHKNKHKQEEKPAEVKEEPVKEEKEARKEIQLGKVEDQTIDACEKFVADVMQAMGMEDVKVTSCVDEEGALSINMEGPNMGILIGKRGQTLDSLQYLTNRVANKMQDGYVRVKLDTEDYRRRRKETLENLAKNIAGKVKRTRRTVVLEPMNPYERRIIHSALQSDPAVTTHSEGEEPYRKVVVTLVRK